jgi:hypothetical protein
MTDSSVVVTIDDTPILVKSIATLKKGKIMDNIIMNALMQLNKARDELVCSAYKVNEGKPGYVPRKPCSYIRSEVANILFSSELSVEETLENPAVQLFGNSGTLLTSYRTIIPYYWKDHKEWMLVIVDSSAKEIHIVYTRYLRPELSGINAELKESQNQQIVSKLTALLSNSVEPVVEGATAAQRSHFVNRSWSIIYVSPDIDSENIPKSYNRTPCHMNCGLGVKQDSGLFIAHAIECDYYDVPVYATPDDWEVIREKLVYYVLNNDLPIM